MNGPNGIERRDPAAGILKLGTVLSWAHLERRSGEVLVRDSGIAHMVRLVDGHIAAVSADQAAELFVLKRPHVIFEERPGDLAGARLINPQPVVLRGVTGRADLFDPRALVDRIPVDVLRLKSGMTLALQRLGLNRDEADFIERLTVPTPISMALWKRGLNPQRAGAVVVALNLLGAFEEWSPGDLPRITAVNQVYRMIQNARPDHELLGVSPEAPARELDRAFRKLSLMLHPDRLTELSETETQRAKDAFIHVSRAHDRLKRSRRSRPVSRQSVFIYTSYRGGEMSAPWVALLEQTRIAEAEGDLSRARVFAVKTMALAPPGDVVIELKRILRWVA
jgi:hypothetical protein